MHQSQNDQCFKGTSQLVRASRSQQQDSKARGTDCRSDDSTCLIKMLRCCADWISPRNAIHVSKSLLILESNSSDVITYGSRKIATITNAGVRQIGLLDNSPKLRRLGVKDCAFNVSKSLINSLHILLRKS